MATRIQKNMLQPIHVLFKYVQSRARISIWLFENTQTRLEGKILGFDEYMNVVLDDAIEVDVKRGGRKNLGRILLKGDNITLVTIASSG